MVDDKKFKLSLWISLKEKDYLDLYGKQHRLKSKSEAFRNIIEEHNTMKADYERMKKDWEKYKVMLTQKPNDEKALPLSPTEKDDEQCLFYDVDRNGKPICRNPSPPLKTSNLTVKACMTCVKLRGKESENEQESINTFHQETKKRVHNLQKRVKRTIDQEETYCQHEGVRVLVKKCEGYCRKLHPYRYQACQEFKACQNNINDATLEAPK